MGDAGSGKGETRPWILPSRNLKKEFLVSGRMVTMKAKNGEASADDDSLQDGHGGLSFLRGGKLLGFPVTAAGKIPETRTDLIRPPEILTLEQVARRDMDGADKTSLMNQLADLGAKGRLLLQYREGKLIRCEVFEDPLICHDVERGGVIHNLEQKPADMSGWRVHDFAIDSKGCLGEVCTRCARVCPENAIHLRGEGASSFCEIDSTACKGCFICWVECSRQAADCILVDGKAFDRDLRARHVGEIGA